MTLELRLEASPASHLVVEVIGWEGQRGPAPHDAWLICKIHCVDDGIAAHVDASLVAGDFHRFNEGLKFIRQNLFGASILETVEDWVRVQVTCTTTATFSIEAEVTGGPHS